MKLIEKSEWLNSLNTETEYNNKPKTKPIPKTKRQILKEQTN
jgi:hypothetical protein